MSLQAPIIYCQQEETARLAHAAFPKGNAYLRLYDALGPIYANPQFAALFPRDGQPAVAPAQLALVTIFQFAEGLSDRQAADAVRDRISWKYALCLPLEDAGFDASVLSEFRARLVAGKAEYQLLDLLLECCKAEGLVKARGKARTDSTHVLAATRALNRLETVGETMRHALNTLASIAPGWLRPRIAPEWLERYGPRVDEYRFPKGTEARQALASQIGTDGVCLYQAATAADAPGWLREVPAVETLRAVWLQQFYAPDEQGLVRWRFEQDAPPSAQLINSPYDVEARYSKKRSTVWTGYKVQVTETCDADTPNLITHVATTPATVQDVEMLPQIHTALAKKDLLPAEHLVDAGYADSDVLVTSKDTHGVEVIGPASQDTHWQARAGEGFDVASFTLDWEQEQATCPQGTPSASWSATRNDHGNPIINIRFPTAACRDCSVRAKCTASATGPRFLTVRPKAQYLATHQARRYQKTPEFQERYAARAGIEATISQGLRVTDLRHARYIGLAKTRLQHVLTAAALNVCRLSDWFAERPRASVRSTPFVQLATAPL
jgi:transposase